ncbi:histone-like nucleoid-structuring protein [Xanthomonas axonopodis]|uniref:Histone-like nucleoid-structuring protein n=2 Tax=Xanthomonas axonopodis TaxID=53413 RepID=A0A098Q2C4_9XANT|nr:H-NS family nucleoid-associated regulatory protein [Xanthomonas axonopodis]KGE52112.1 histone-like nucleoid-structuring protein [Xanthomonas axonopodis pv. vasculorum]KPL47512.1 histone-like nucleoid-structuring protein [Xanthomonas axonopodis]PPV10809.1 histone-like nucleoid-structuring protein [Xanthomonas axonopodis pv. vasculorum]QKD86939.1 H-NS histone family protein [Xanthomonas axonopodis pv. vasculorum]
MSNTSSKLDSIAQAKAKLLDELQKLEEQEKTERASEASSAHATIVSLLEQFAGHFNTKQRNDIAAYLGTTAARKEVTKSGRSEVKPKYELPHTGETWSGRGRTPKAFAAWEGSVSYKEWKAKNPDLKFPLVRE